MGTEKNRGVSLGVEVELDPKAVREGHDPQLEKAVEIVLEELRKKPIPAHKRPPYPNYHNGAGTMGHPKKSATQ
jgi:tricorn protease